MVTFIATKGLPGVGKSTFAERLASERKMVFLTKDDVRDFAVVYDARCNALMNSLDENSKLKIDSNSMCYDVIFRIIQNQLRIGFDVIFESPLARLDLYEKCMAIATECGATFGVIQCELSRAEWERRLMARKLKDQLDEDKNNTQSTILHRPSDADSILNKYNGSYLYPIDHTHLLLVDLAQPLSDLVIQASNWIDSL
mmetsp:Transcript_1613/g.2877  ORF Transcript_1613/g.2877 Transcript_1613/m.2877 type:complete len:199 (-) Transcript_1613:1299-1895(-)